VGSTDASLTFAYPTTDEKGQSLLVAGFLDDIERLFDSEAWQARRSEVRRFDPVPGAAFAEAPAEARIRAVSLACEGRALAEIAPLARSASPRGALEGTAAALRVARLRLAREFGPYDGVLRDARAARRIAEGFGPSRAAFSPSQL